MCLKQRSESGPGSRRIDGEALSELLEVCAQQFNFFDEVSEHGTVPYVGHVACAKMAVGAWR